MPDWSVPAAFAEVNAADAVRLDWAARVPAEAERLAREWTLVADGAARAGHMGVVWPVRDAHGRPLALKLGCDPGAVRAEARALRAWERRSTCVRLVAADAATGAVLLERLDADRDLMSVPDVGAATELIADLLARSAVPAPADVPAYAVEAERVRRAIEEHRVAKKGIVPDRAVGAALETLSALGSSTSERLLHFDAHYLNVLHTVPGEAPVWRLIDPLPHAGPAEIEPIAALRNRFGEAAATGDPDRALRRRLDIFVDRLGLDVGLARRVAHAVAVDNLLWLRPERPDHPFIAPYTVMLGWA